MALQYQRSACEELLEEDGLLVYGVGLDVQSVLRRFIGLYCRVRKGDEVSCNIYFIANSVLSLSDHWACLQSLQHPVIVSAYSLRSHALDIITFSPFLISTAER